MLKELWRKLGAEFLHDDGSSQDSQSGLFGTGASGNKEAFRILPHITHTGEFHLERLTGLLKTRYGKSFNRSIARCLKPSWNRCYPVLI